jgi:hypothetical protein
MKELKIKIKIKIKNKKNKIGDASWESRWKTRENW